MKRILIMWTVLGAAYVALETLWRGHSHPSMFVVGGLCGVLVGAINQHPRFYNMKIFFQSLFGAGIVLSVEFVSGLVLNVWLGLGVWDYTGQIGNVMGQICLPYGVLWLLLMPFAIWLEDTARWLFWSWAELLGRGGGTPPPIPPYTAGSIYRDFFTGR